MNYTMSGTADIVKNGSSTFRFGTPFNSTTIPTTGPSANTWMGMLTINGGTIRFNNNNESGRTALRANPVTIANGGSQLTCNSEIRIQSIHQLADSANQFLAGSGESHGVATENVESNIGFELLDLSTHIRLRNIQTFGGSAEVQLPGDGQHVLQLSERGRDAHTLGCL